MCAVSFEKNSEGKQGMNNEELLEQLESVANFMRGMQFDLRIPSDTRQALIERAQELNEVVEKHLNAN